VTVCLHVPEFDDTVGGKPAGARRKRYTYVHRSIRPQPEVRLVGHPGRVAVGRFDLPLASEEGLSLSRATPMPLS
jgi:hypothetical protein